MTEKIIYKSRLLGVPIQFVDPAYTSQRCSRCNVICKSNRLGKEYKCSGCGHVDHADVNAAFNIARSAGITVADTALGRLIADRDAVKGFSETPQSEIANV